MTKPVSEVKEANEDQTILHRAKVSAKIIEWFESWCNKTKRSGGILITTSIKELLTDFYNDNLPDGFAAPPSGGVEEAAKEAEKRYPSQPGKHWVRVLTEAKKEAFIACAKWRDQGEDESKLWNEVAAIVQGYDNFYLYSNIMDLLKQEFNISRKTFSW